MEKDSPPLVTALSGAHTHTALHTVLLTHIQHCTRCYSHTYSTAHGATHIHTALHTVLLTHIQHCTWCYSHTYSTAHGATHTHTALPTVLLTLIQSSLICMQRLLWCRRCDLVCQPHQQSARSSGEEAHMCIQTRAVLVSYNQKYCDDP